MKLEKEYSVAVYAARKAGEYLKQYRKFTVDSELGKDIKLSVDKKSEKIIIDILSVTNIPILSEEAGYIGGDNCRLRWIIDPLDGTANYWKGIKDLCGVSIALWSGDLPLLGVVNRFDVGEIFSGIVGEGAWLNDDIINTNSVDDLGNAVLATGFPVNSSYAPKDLSRFIACVQNFKKIRMLGAASLMGSYVACGRVDGYIENNIMLWDVAAATAIVKAAGGVCNIKVLDDNKCLCGLFANEELYSAYCRLEG